MEHDSLIVAQALGFAHKKELVAYYTKYPQIESKIKDLKSECINYLKCRLPYVVNMVEVKDFHKKFIEKENEERQRFLREKQKAEEETHRKLVEEAQLKQFEEIQRKIYNERYASMFNTPVPVNPVFTAPTIASPPKPNFITKVDSETPVNKTSKDRAITELENQLAETKSALIETKSAFKETTRKLQNMEIERSKYRSLYKSLKRRSKPFLNKLLLQALE